jgi:DNA-binding response OmpR family regulator
MADATAHIANPSGRLAGETREKATAADAAHWVAVYTELLSFKDELLEVTARRRATMSRDASAEADADETVLTAQAERYAERLLEWRGRLGTASEAGTPATVPPLFVEGRARAFGHLLIDPWRKLVVNGGVPLELTSIEWQLLRIFLEHPGETLTRPEIAAGVWGDLDGSGFGRVEVSVSRLRRKLDPTDGPARLIETVRGVGYRLMLPRA